MAALTRETIELLLTDLCNQLTQECKQGKLYTQSKDFEKRVRDATSAILAKRGIDVAVDFSPHPFEFPDIVLGEFGIEVKLSTQDTWRSIANSVFEGFRSKKVVHIYVVFGKMGGDPSVRWGHYERSVMHVRTSHVPRFEIDLDAKESLFAKFGVSYGDFTRLSEEERMRHVRKYARDRLKKGERLWWLEDINDGHSLQLGVRLFSNLTSDEKLRLRAEASLLCPQIVGSSRNRTKYSDPILYLLTYRGVLASRDAFSAGSAAGPERGGIYVQKALKRIESQMVQAASDLDGSLFSEYWGKDVAPELRIREWLKLADHFAQKAKPRWKPSNHLFLASK